MRETRTGGVMEIERRGQRRYKIICSPSSEFFLLLRALRAPALAGLSVSFFLCGN
jgi:hypothetical protein